MDLYAINPIFLASYIAPELCTTLLTHPDPNSSQGLLHWIPFTKDKLYFSNIYYSKNILICLLNKKFIDVKNVIRLI